MRNQESVAIKPSTTVAELIRQALDVFTYKCGDRPLNKHEVLGVRGINHCVILRGNTNLTQFGWAILSGPGYGSWQCDLNHNRFVRGTPKEVALSFHSQGMLDAIPEGQGLYRLLASGLGYRAEEVQA